MIDIAIWPDEKEVYNKISIYRKGQTHHEYLNTLGEWFPACELSCGNYAVPKDALLDIHQTVKPAYKHEEII